MASAVFCVSYYYTTIIFPLGNHYQRCIFVFGLDVLNVSDHSPMVCSTSLKVVNTVNMIFKYYLPHAAVSVENLLLAVLSRPCLLHGILLVSVVRYAISSWLIVGLFAIGIELYVMNVMLLIKLFCQEDIYVSNASMLS